MLCQLKKTISNHPLLSIFLCKKQVSKGAYVRRDPDNISLLHKYKNSCSIQRDGIRVIPDTACGNGREDKRILHHSMNPSKNIQSLFKRSGGSYDAPLCIRNNVHEIILLA